MDIQQCFKVLELDADASPEAARQAYKDLVNIWHPDRFASNPRLQKKSEDKLKQINIAYETLQPVLASPETAASRTETPEKQPPPEARRAPDNRPKMQAAKTGTDSSGKTEAFVEAGTGLVLNVFATLYRAVRDMVKDTAAGLDASADKPMRPGGTDSRGTCRRQGPGQGGGRGRGKGGGRGRGRR